MKHRIKSQPRPASAPKSRTAISNRRGNANSDRRRAARGGRRAEDEANEEREQRAMLIAEYYSKRKARNL